MLQLCHVQTKLYSLAIGGIEPTKPKSSIQRTPRQHTLQGLKKPNPTIHNMITKQKDQRKYIRQLPTAALENPFKPSTIQWTAKESLLQVSASDGWKTVNDNQEDYIKQLWQDLRRRRLRTPKP